MSRLKVVAIQFLLGRPESFWWGDGYLPTAYFNVSIEPNAEGLDLIPLIEEGGKLPPSPLMGFVNPR